MEGRRRLGWRDWTSQFFYFMTGWLNQHSYYRPGHALVLAWLLATYEFQLHYCRFPFPLSLVPAAGMLGALSACSA